MKDILKFLDIASEIASGMSNFSNSFTTPLDRGILGKGFTLVPLDIEDNKLGYSYLYKDGVKINDNIFRFGGMSNGFNKGNYCNLIQYDSIKETIGNSCIIDNTGKIVLKSKNILSYPYFLKGCIAIMDKEYYNLLTQTLIVKGSHSINSEKYLFVENHYNKDYKFGVYKIDYETGEFEIFD